MRSCAEPKVWKPAPVLKIVDGAVRKLDTDHATISGDALQQARVGMAAGTYYTGRYLGGVVGATLAGALLGTAVTATGVTLGFVILAGVMVVVTVASLGLSGPRATAPA